MTSKTPRKNSSKPRGQAPAEVDSDLATSTESSAPPIPTIHPMPMVRLDLVIMAVVEGQLRILLSHRKEAPHKGRWGLPGGVLRIDLDASLEEAAVRVGQERLGLRIPNLELVTAVGGAQRDPRAPWAMSVVYRSLLGEIPAVTPGKRVQALEWRTWPEEFENTTLAFDHARLIEHAVRATRRQIADLHVPRGWLPEAFTIPEFQSLSEAVLGQMLDKVTLRRRLEAAGIFEPIAGAMRGGAHRPAQLYRLAKAAAL